MAIYGYARCSTSEDKQDINRQVRELKASGAEEVIFEYEHGDAKVKKELHMLLEMAEPGETLSSLWRSADCPEAHSSSVKSLM